LSRLMFERLADLRFLTYPSNTIITNLDDNINLGEKIEYLILLYKCSGLNFILYIHALFLA